MATYAVNTGITTDGVQSLRQVTDQLQSSLAELMAKAEQFKGANAGVAIDSYDQAQQLWTQGMREMQDALGIKGNSLNHITNGYIDADLQGARGFQR
ncbi:WXG100 family type VII secretion target [Actinoplanes sp. HUAS TT8]|uniref:WXG100 family type VII secretion target n=1 Tax=Actinoplanes sp. HUAS TT8 TaxID=3447453 RepID=UPI003F523364